MKVVKKVCAPSRRDRLYFDAEAHLIGAMDLQVDADRVRVRAPAKLNLFLEVTGQRADGYHDLETVMVAVDLHDTLELWEEPELGRIEVETLGATLPDDEGNLVVRAARLLQRSTDVRRGARIRLDKRIPIQAGLGGGSSDAAATLAGLNALWRLGLPQTRLQELGLQAGSDVPFFLAARAATCRGRGERIEPWGLGGSLWFAVLAPAFGTSTAAVFQSGLVDLEQPRHRADEVVRLLDQGPPATGGLWFNRLLSAAHQVQPALADVTAAVARMEGCGYGMSGSGSAHFVLCRDRRHAETVAATMDATRLGRTFVTRTLA